MKKSNIVRYDVDTDQVSTNIENMLDMLNKSARINRKYVYVVLEHHGEFADSNKKLRVVNDEKIHGVYTTRESAEKKRNRLYGVQIGSAYGSISILKFKIKGE